MEFVLRYLILTAACLSALTATPASASFPADELVLEAISKAKAMAFRSDQIDWVELEKKVRAEAQGAKDEVDLLRAYHVLLDGLGDGHSFVNADREERASFKARHGSEFDADRKIKPITSRFTRRSDPEKRSVSLGSSSVHLITVPTRGGGGPQGEEYANAIYGSIVGAAETSCGFIVDVRGNRGGNVWLMVAGLSPLLGDGWQSFEINSSGERSSAAHLEKGAAVISEGEYKGSKITEVADWQELPALRTAPVAVLIDDAVASSGEGVVIAFKGRANTRFFGETTSGTASSNEGFLIGKGTNLVITTAMMADRTGTIYPNGVSPDVAVAFGDGSVSDPEDAVVEAAKAWFLQQPGCQADQQAVTSP